MSPLPRHRAWGLNAFFAYTVVLALGYSYAQSLVVVFISGILFIVITKIGLREAIIRAIPDSVINAVTPGVGLFITIIGLKNSGLVVSNESTLLSLVDFSLWRTPGADVSGLCSALVALIGLISHCLIKLLTGKAKDVNPLTIAVSLIFVLRYAFITLG